MSQNFLNKVVIPDKLRQILNDVKSIIVPNSKEELFNLALGGKNNLTFDVSYNINGKNIKEATVIKCKNGIAVNFEDSSIRRRDPNSMVIADNLPTDKTTYKERFGKDFEEDKELTFKWLENQEELIILPFFAGNEDLNIGYPAIAIMPSNAGFFATGLANLQGFIPKNEVPEKFEPKAIIYVVPPFRHTHFEGKQIVVHNRLENIHEVFSYNLYPGPSAKKGIYSILLNLGEKEDWVTLHASTVKIVTPYELTLTIMHEGASGSGKSEMTESFHRQSDGSLLLATNIISNEKTILDMADNCELYPVTDDMALAHPTLQNGKKLVVSDAEFGWFLRVDHIKKYGTEPEIEEACMHPKEPLVFFNIDAVPNSTCIIWEHIEDSPGVTCPNPRIIFPRSSKKNIVNSSVEVDIRSFGVRTPPSTKENPNYGIIGIFHILPPALAWLWRLVAPRGFANPSIVTNNDEMKSEGVGSYWPFATGKKVRQANLLLEQILNTLSTRYILIPNQYIGAYKVGFAGQWATREYIARRGGCNFKPESLKESKCPLLGYTLESMKIDGTYVPKKLLQVNLQSEVGEEGYNSGAKILTDFFKQEIKQFDVNELHPLGKEIIKACLNDVSVNDYYNLIPKL